MNTEIYRLFQKFVAGECRAEELEQVKTHLGQGNYTEEWQAVLREEAERIQGAGPDDLSDFDFNEAKLYRRIRQTIGTPHEEKQTLRLWPRIAVAASILLAVSFGGYFLWHKQEIKPNANLVSAIKPGSNGAILTLSNGQKLVLGQAKIGIITRQNGSDLRKAADSLLIYQSSPAGSGTVSYNTLETPKGKQYSVILPDGSRVWLNAASSLQYPTSFTGKERSVELKGEAYFEVAHSKSQPFKVKTATETVQDIGTHFNINCYADEPAVKTTLLEGAIKVNDRLLEPGQQAVLNLAGELKVRETDADEAVAWKNGKFVFEQEDIPGIMRKLARWYNVEVNYQANFAGKTFTGSISRFDNISKILDKITFTSGIHFEIQGRRITVSQ